jgi:hypothetical protein
MIYGALPQEERNLEDASPAKVPEQPFKELIVLIPIFGTAIAISYDVGYFYGIDIRLFTLFSIAEHMVFALEAAPFAFGIAVGLVAFIGSGADLQLGKAIQSVGQRRNLFIDAAVIALVAITVGWMIYFRRLGFFAGVATGFFIALSRMVHITKRTTYLVAGVLVIGTAYAFGYDNARSYLLSGQAQYSIQIDKELASQTVQIIRSGDKGILYYDPKTNLVSFVRWEAVTKLTEHLVIRP